jgi:monoamine oxidase/CRP-like cAMP-binding protein
MRKSVAMIVNGSESPREIRRVIVIGAGLAGLSAARALAERGIEVIVVEGRDRIGGRAHTVDGVDHGAHWIHGTEGNPLTNLARELGVPTLFVGGDSSYSGGWDHLALHGPGGRPLGDGEKLDSILLADEIRDELDALRRRLSASGARDISVRDALAQVLATRELDGDARAHVEWHSAVWARDDCAADDDALSALWWDDGYQVYGYGDSVFTGGYGALTSALARDLDVRLAHVVRSVEYGGGAGAPVTVVTDQGPLDADAVIVTVPLGVLKAGAIGFFPPLPSAKRDAIARLGMGSFAKVVVTFERPFWRREQYVFGHAGAAVAQRPTMLVNLWKTHRIPALVALAGGSLACSIERWDEETLRRWTMELLRDVFGAEVPAPLRIERTSWGTDPFSRGAYSFVAVGSTPDDIETLAEPVAGSVFFAGEATYRHHWAAAHGAVASGLREAARLLRDPTLLPTRIVTENRRWRDMMMRATRLLNVLSSKLPPDELRQRMELLADSDVFSVVPSSEVAALATMFQPVTFAAREVICRAGDRAQQVFVVASGELEVLDHDGQLIATLGRGRVVGEYGAFHSGVRTATVVAREDASALALDYQRFERFLLAFPESALALLKLTIARLGRDRRTPIGIVAVRA